MTRLIFAVALATAIAACSAPDQAKNVDTGNQPETGTMNVDSKAWQLDSLDGEPAPEGDKAPTMQFDKQSSRASGYAGCNRYFAEYTISGDTLSLGPVGATKRMCEPQAMAVEDRFLAALTGDVRLAMKGEQLVLSAADGAELVFSQTSAPK